MRALRVLDGLGGPRVLDGLGGPRVLDGLGGPRVPHGLDGLDGPRVPHGLGVPHGHWARRGHRARDAHENRGRWARRDRVDRAVLHGLRGVDQQCPCRGGSRRRQRVRRRRAWGRGAAYGHWRGVRDASRVGTRGRERAGCEGGSPAYTQHAESSGDDPSCPVDHKISPRGVAAVCGLVFLTDPHSRTKVRARGAADERSLRLRNRPQDRLADFCIEQIYGGGQREPVGTGDGQLLVIARRVDT